MKIAENLFCRAIRPDFQEWIQMSFNRNRNTDNQIDENTPLYSSRITLTYLEFIKRYYRDVDTDSLLTYAGMTRHEVEDAGHWFNQSQADRFNEFLVAKTGNLNIAREAGRFTVSSEKIGAAKQYAQDIRLPMWT